MEKLDYSIVAYFLQQEQNTLGYQPITNCKFSRLKMIWSINQMPIWMQNHLFYYKTENGSN